jgi:uncharacterized protein with PIN domain
MTACFIIDGMLGGLSRWLRILGFDTIYYIDKDDEELKIEAKKSERILVTRDHELFRQAKNQNINAILIQSEQTVEQLQELVELLDLSLTPKNTRCPKCNNLINPVDKELISDKVPPESFNAFEEYWICSNCGAVYWKGSHWEQILKTLENIDTSKYL